MSNGKRKIAVPIVDRANYGRLKPVLLTIQSHKDMELQIICSGSTVLERFGLPINDIRKDGFPVVRAVHIEIEGSIPSTMAKSFGMGVIEFASEFQQLQPDLLLAIGDRYEMLSAVIAASFMNIPIAHIQGGEVSGSIDENTRHAITKFAQYHFPATQRAAEYVIQMGEDPRTVFNFGCPGSEVARLNEVQVTSDTINAHGSGAALDIERPFVLVIYHPVTTSFGHETEPVAELITALDELKMQTLWLWPNIDAGADHISKLIRLYREHHNPDWLRLAKNFSPEVYGRILAKAAVAVGNSSSFVRDSGFYGTPVLLVGDRQIGREFSENVTVAPREDAATILGEIRRKLQHGRYPPSRLYGDGYVARKIADKLAEVPLYVQKHLHYIYR